MSCSKCGCATKCVDSTQANGSGPFKEEVECAKGHTGIVVGDESKSPDQWNRFGKVFQE